MHITAYILSSTSMTTEPASRATLRQRSVEAFQEAPSLHPLVVGHMFKQDKSSYTFSKRYFALYEGGLLAYYTHQREFEEDVRKHKGLPLNCKLVKLNGVFLTKPTEIQHSVKHSFVLHAPDSSNHRDEFQLVCSTKKDMRIWVEQLQSQNTQLAHGNKEHRTPAYIQKIRLQTIASRQSSQTSNHSQENITA